MTVGIFDTEIFYFKENLVSEKKHREMESCKKERHRFRSAARCDEPDGGVPRESGISIALIETIFLRVFYSFPEWMSIFKSSQDGGRMQDKGIEAFPAR